MAVRSMGACLDTVIGTSHYIYFTYVNRVTFTSIQLSVEMILSEAHGNTK